MEDPSLGIPTSRSSVEIHENSKQDPQISVKVYIGDDPELVQEAARMAYRNYIVLRHQIDKGVPNATKLAAMGLTTDHLTDPDPEE